MKKQERQTIEFETSQTKCEFLEALVVATAKQISVIQSQNIDANSRLEQLTQLLEHAVRSIRHTKVSHRRGILHGYRIYLSTIPRI